MKIHAVFAVLLGALGMAPSTAAPDIAPEPISRWGENLAPIETTEIEMVAELVEITLFEDRAHVDARFELVNTADEPETLEVGFPSAARPASYSMSSEKVEVFGWSDQDHITSFVARVDGKPVTTSRKARSVEGEPRRFEMDGEVVEFKNWDHQFWLCWNMTVAAGKRCLVEVSYDVASKDSNYVEPSRLQNREIVYVLVTGRGWKGPIGEARIIVRPSAEIPLSRVEIAAPEPADRDEERIEWLFEDFEPDSDVLLRYHLYADAEDAVRRTRAGIEKAPTDWELLLDLAENLEALERWTEAAEVFERIDAIEKTWVCGRPQTDYVPSLYRAAGCLRKAGDSAAAKQMAARAIESMRGLHERLGMFWYKARIPKARLDAYVEELKAW